MGFSLQHGNRLIAVLTLIAVFLLGSTSFAVSAETDIFRLKDLKIGMKGIGKTVIQGRRIENFDVEILGILTNNKATENMLLNGKSILVRVGGDVIRRAGGIAAGMSGSPVYINNKLVGGISSGWIMTDHTVGLVTPIEEMLEIWAYPETACNEPDNEPVKWFLEKPVKLGMNKIDTIWETACQSGSAVVPAANELVFQHAAADVYVEGLGEDAVKVLNKNLKRSNLRVLEKTLESIEALPKDEFETGPDSYLPGSAFGIQLACGDVNVTTLGTITHREGNRILALAHSFLKKGRVSYLLTGAHIYHSFASLEMPFKIGAPTEMLGIITQDREKGVAGEIDRFPEMVPVQIDVVDKDLKIEKHVNFQIVRDASILGSVLESTLVQALEGIIDREGDGTAKMNISLDCENTEHKQYSFRRENIFYSSSDIVQSLLTEVLDLIDMTTGSDVEEVMPTRLLLNIEVEKKRRTVTIEKVDVKNLSVAGGGVLDVEVTLRPFREKKIIRKVKISLPQDIGKDNLTLSVFGLQMHSDDSNTATEGQDTKVKDILSDDSVEDFESVMRNWANMPKNSDMLFQLSVDGDDSKKIKLGGRNYEIQPTNFVVTGRVDTTLTLSEE